MQWDIFLSIKCKMDITTAKTVGVFLVIIGCFTVMYPKIFHPLIFGGGSPKRNPHEEMMNNLPPHMREKPVGDGSGQDVHRKEAMKMAHQMHRPGPNPGMRAAAEMKKAEAGGGGGRGMMGIVLPVYAVGIVMYLIYTLVKVFVKKQDTTEYDNNLREHYRELRFDPYTKNFKFGNFEDQRRSSEKTGFDFFADSVNPNNLEDLLLKAATDERNITGRDYDLHHVQSHFEEAGESLIGGHLGNYEMNQLRMKLEETEVQMARILEAMKVVQNQSTDLARAAGESVDSSPDLDSYEVLNRDYRTCLEEDAENFGDSEDFYEDSDEIEGHIEHVEDIGSVDDGTDTRYTGIAENYINDQDSAEQEIDNEDVHSEFSEHVPGSGDTGSNDTDQVTTQTECDDNDDVCDVADEEIILSDNHEENPDLRHRVVTAEPASDDQ